MRPKYRVWNSNVNRFENWHIINQEGKIITTEAIGLRVNEYIHRTDCNNKEIYEGDMLYDAFYNVPLGFVAYKHDTCRFEVYNGICYTPISEFSSNQIKIIGNRYESKDWLLKIGIMETIVEIIETELNNNNRITWLRNKLTLEINNEESEIIEEQINMIYGVNVKIGTLNLYEYIEEIYKTRQLKED